MNIEQLRAEITLLRDEICYALHDPTRLMILYLLAERPRLVSEMVEALEQPQSTISRHLQVLRHRALVQAERQGQAVEYSLTDTRIIEALDLMRAMLQDQVASRATIIERTEE